MPFRANRGIAAGLSFLLAAMVPFVAVLPQGCSRTGLEETHEGEMVYYGSTSRIRGFDPVKAGDVASALASSRIYEGLVEYAYLDRPYHVQAALAEALPDISEDGLTYTFKIRQGIYFQDDPCFTRTGGKGRELVAEDFVYSVKRVADMKNASTGFWAFNDRLVGLDEWRETTAGDAPSDYDAFVEGLHAPDLYTLVMKLKRPYPQLLWILTMHYAFAVPREAVEYYGREFVNHPVGTGPYILKRYRQNYRYEYVRNPKWAETGREDLYPEHGAPDDPPELLEDAGKPIPFIDRIIQYVVDDSTTEWLMFLTGAFESSGVSRDNWDVVITKDRMLTPELSRKGVRLLSAPTLTIFYIGFNMDDPVVGRGANPEEAERTRKLRQALTCAFDSESYIRFYNNRITRPKGPIPPGMAGYDDKPSPFPFDVERARKLLAEAGYPEGRDPKTGRRLQLILEMGSGDNPEFRQAAELIANFMERIGVVLRPSYNNWPTFLEKMERRQMQLFSLGWVADYPDAENFLQLFYGPNHSPGPNHCNYQNAEFDVLYEKARVMQDTPERSELYRKMAEIVVEDCPWIFTSNPLAYGLHHEWIRNYKYHDFPYGMAKYYKIDVEARDEWKKEYGKKR
jgi:ABC-type transport system substrate-binding protein